MKSILVVTYWSFDEALIQSYTLPYLKIIKDIIGQECQIFLVTFERDKKDKQVEIIEVENGLKNIRFRMFPFGLSAIIEVRRALQSLKSLIKKENINYLHGWCATGNGIAMILQKSSNIPFIADSFEPNADAMVETGIWKKNSLAFFIQFYLEKRTARVANELIAISPHMERYCLEKYGINRKINYIKPACVDLKLFDVNKRKNKTLIKELGLEGKTIGIYAGKLGGLYLKNELFDLLFVAEKEIGENFRFILLSKMEENELIELCNQSGVSRSKILFQFVPHNQVPDFLGIADFAIGAYIPAPSRNTCSPIKDGEYWAMGLPVIITNDISNDSELIASTNCGYVLKSLDRTEYTRSINHILKLISDPHEKEETAKRCRMLAEEYRDFSIAKNIYNSIYNHSEKNK